MSSAYSITFELWKASGRLFMHTKMSQFASLRHVHQHLPEDRIQTTTLIFDNLDNGIQWYTVSKAV